MVGWFISLPAWVLVVGCLLISLVVAALSRIAVRALVPEGEADHVQSIAAPLMPALGATFAVLMALTLASEAGYLRTAQDDVSHEAAAASRLAWSATNPGVDSAPIQDALRTYLETVIANEWRGGDIAERDRPAVAAAIVGLERTVRSQAGRASLGTPASTELLTSLDAVTTARRERLAAASREVPGLYVLTLVVSGIALIANAAALTFRSSARTSVLVIGLATVVGLSLALLFALTAPWDGPLVVSRLPIETVIDDLRSGFFHS